MVSSLLWCLFGEFPIQREIVHEVLSDEQLRTWLGVDHCVEEHGKHNGRPAFRRTKGTFLHDHEGLGGFIKSSGKCIHL